MKKTISFRSAFCFSSFLAVLTLLQLPAGADSMAGASAECPHAVLVLNDSFRESYVLAKENIRKNLGPIVIATGGDLVLLYKGKRDPQPCVPENYSILKTVDHIPLGIFVILNEHCDKPLDDATKVRLASFKGFADKAVESVAKAELSAKTQERQTKIITRSQMFINEVLAAGSVSHGSLRHFTTEASRDTLLNADEAIDDQFTAMDCIIENWRQKLTAEEWKHTNFIIMSGHMPRLKNSNLQYFEKITGEKEEGLRIIYAEGLSKEDEAVDLLVTHILDRQIAIDFYHDEWRMHRDLLSDAASKYLAKHKPLRD
ncbi:MAG: hypothetical protein P4L53_24880 [Candidatus Obscuribacterales bacterium]|nr:hypothetical protein [Candidatus Obscuribacterales bacterium]